MLILIKSSFIDYKLTILRNKKTSDPIFRQTMNETSYLIASKVLDYIKFNKTPINTPLKKTYGLEVSQPIVIIPILRAGLGLVEGFIKFLPNAEKGHIGLYRDEQTYKPVEYLFKLPKIKKQLFIVLDPMLATGNSSLEAVNLIVKSGVKISNLMLVSLLCAPEGIKTIEKKYPKLRIFTTSVDKGLDNNKFIVPGLGDAGDRYMGT
tara:strand:- start:967 stop:1587 length:621 start_codon:yes stop_codon:yes gene_type:complete